jgi:hypothetical protein
MRMSLQASFIAMVMPLAACATIIHGATQNVGVTCSPSNAKVSIDHEANGETPLIVDLKRAQDHVVRVELAGYEPFEAVLTHHVSGWVWGNILIGGLIGLAVDAITGGLYVLRPEQVHATLTKQQATSATWNKDRRFLSVVLAPHPRWQ